MATEPENLGGEYGLLELKAATRDEYGFFSRDEGSELPDMIDFAKLAK